MRKLLHVKEMDRLTDRANTIQLLPTRLGRAIGKKFLRKAYHPMLIHRQSRMLWQLATVTVRYMGHAL